MCWTKNLVIVPLPTSSPPLTRRLRYGPISGTSVNSDVIVTVVQYDRISQGRIYPVIAENIINEKLRGLNSIDVNFVLAIRMATGSLYILHLNVLLQ